MKPLLPLLLLVACETPPLLPPEVPTDLPAHCATKARLPTPPRSDDRSIGQLVAWARAAGKAANGAIAERDACALDYLRLRAACMTSSGCIIPYPGAQK